MSMSKNSFAVLVMHAMLNAACILHVHGERCTGRRFAVLEVGVTERFVLEPTLRHVVAPAAKAGWCVDYFLQLSGKWNAKWLDVVYRGARPAASPYQSMSQEQFTSTVLKKALV